MDLKTKKNGPEEDQPVSEHPPRRWPQIGSWFQLGLLLGLLLGLAPAYWVLTNPWDTVRSPHGEGTVAAIQSEGQPSTEVNKACTDLGSNATRLRASAEERGRTQAFLAAAHGDSPILYPSGVQTADGIAGGRATRAAPVGGPGSLTLGSSDLENWTATREVLTDSWDLLADADKVLRACKLGEASVSGTPKGSGHAVAGGSSVHRLLRLGQISELSGRVAKALTSAADVAGEKGAVVFGSTARRSDGTSPNRAKILPHFTDWYGLWAYGVGFLGSASESPRSADASRDAVRQARAHLLEELLSLQAEPGVSLQDLAAQHPALRRGVLRLVDAVEISSRRVADGAVLWVEASLPLVGQEALLPLLIPFASGNQRGSQLELAVDRAASPLHSTSEAVGEDMYSGIVIDARSLAVTPTLFPRFVSDSGSDIRLARFADPNRAARHGFCFYTPFPGEARLKAGSKPLWLRAAAENRSGGSYVLSQADAYRLAAARASPEASGPPVIVLVN